MSDTYEGRTANGDLSEAIRQAVSAASREHGQGFSWELVKIDGSHGFVPFEIGATIKVLKS